MKKSFRLKRGFSLVEVAVALSIASFCMVTLMGLIPVGLHKYQQADNQSVMANLTTSVAQDLQSTTVSNSTATSPRFQFNIPAPGPSTAMPLPQNAYVDASGTPRTNLSNNSIYRISVAFFPPAAGLKNATLARIMVTFPAQADANPGIWPTKYSSMFETTVALNRN
jgi:uncharacterized protein (TIGR02598 family)